MEQEQKHFVVHFPIERVANILLNLIDEINLEEMNFDELFEMMNDTLKKYRFTIDMTHLN